MASRAKLFVLPVALLSLPIGGLIVGDFVAALGSLVLTWPAMLISCFAIFPFTPIIKAYDKEYGEEVSGVLFRFLWITSAVLAAVAAACLLTNDFHYRVIAIFNLPVQRTLKAALSGFLSGIASVLSVWIFDAMFPQSDEVGAGDKEKAQDGGAAALVKPSPRNHSSSLYNLLGLALTFTGLVNLLSDIDREPLQQKLAGWLEAYIDTANHIGDHLWRWIDIGWIHISPSGDHVVIFSIILWVSMFIAEYRRDIRDGFTSRKAFIATAKYIVVAVAPISIVPLLLLPGQLGLLLGTAGLLLATGAALTAPPRDACVSGVELFRELVGVLSVFVLFVAIYSTLSRL